MDGISVTLPAYGDSPHLREAVAAVLAQDDDAWDLVILDDGPPDAALADWCDGLGPQVTYHRNPERLGINRNFQQCLEVATRDLMVVLGADDRMRPGYVRSLRAAAAANPEVAWVHPRVEVVDESGRPTSTLQDRVKARLAIDAPAVVGGEALAVSLLRGNWMYFPAVAFRTAVVREHGFRPGWDIVLDLDLYLRLLVDGAAAYLHDDPCFEYRRHGASLSSTERRTGARFVEERRFFRQAAAELDRVGWHRASRAARRHLTSRLHAAALLPATAVARDWTTLGRLARHAAL